MVKRYDPKLLERRLSADNGFNWEYISCFQRDRARIIHSSSFRRLQGKTQVTGTNEGDFHRNRLTHSIEVSQIAYSLLKRIQTGAKEDEKYLKGMPMEWLPDRDLIEAACLGHDIGHPPFGHGGERELFRLMRDKGGFEGNAQSLRILTKLDKYSDGDGINSTRRLVLAVLKYPVPYSQCVVEDDEVKPPKCYYSEDENVVNLALEDFSDTDKERFQSTNDEGEAQFKTFDCSLMDLADDISNAVHDLEDIIARKMVAETQIRKSVKNGLSGYDNETIEQLCNYLLSKHGFERKIVIDALVLSFINRVTVKEIPRFQHPLLKYNVVLSSGLERLRKELGDINFKHVVNTPQVQQLEQRGQYLVGRVFEKLLKDPERLIPKWEHLYRDKGQSDERTVCDYVAGMTDDFLTKTYQRLFVPGYGSSRDEL